MKHVYGKRNKLAIFLRSLDNRVHKKVAAFFKGKSNAQKGKDILVYPAFKTAEDLASIMNRFAWAFPEPSGIRIRFAAEGGLDINKIDFASLLPNQDVYFHQNKNLEQVDAKELGKLLPAASLVAVHKKASKYSPALLSHLGKVKIMDPEYYSLDEPNFWKFGYYDMLNAEEKAYYRDLSKQNFLAFKAKNGHKQKSNIFLTGPSYNSYTDFTFNKEESVMIVCNTIVKDTEFMEYIGGPDIVTFADPVFHFSSCKYAHEFRRLIMAAVEKYGTYVAVPASTVPLMIGNYPQLKDKIIGLQRSDVTVFPDEDHLYAKPSGSIITFIMLPLASALAKQVYVLGADGRGTNENYFWKHNDKVQLEDLKESVFITHPSFFRDRDYADHYQKHCEYIEEVIAKGEQMGKEYFSLTESFIPALKNRQAKKAE